MRKGALPVVLIVALAGAAGLSAAEPAGPQADTAKRAKKMGKRVNAARRARLKAFRSCGQLARYGRRHRRRGEGVAPPPFVGVPRTPPRAVPEGGERPGAAPVADRQDSGTNVQEAHVGEPDIVKARGTRIFAVAGNRVHAVDTTGGGLRLAGSLELEGYGHQLLLRRDRLLVVSQTYGAEPYAAGVQQSPDIAPGGPGEVIVTEVDVGDLNAIRAIRTERIPGSFVSARLNGRTARLVISAPPPALYEPGDPWMPRRTLASASSGRTSTRRLAPCRRVRRPARFFSGLELVTVLTVDLSKGLPAVDSDAVMTSGETVYASSGSLYVATQRWTGEPDSPQAEPPRTFTAVHRFDISEPGVTAYRASGRLPGYLLNQFSLSEHHGVLRAASTATPSWWEGQEREQGQSFVTTLDERQGALVQLGQVGGLGKGERIYAVRFIGDNGFVVTFRQVDPLYTVDLAKPAEPRVLGELKIPGYSAYLHRVGRDLLLGVGQDATEDGQLRGTQLSLFDVSNLRNPTRLHALPLGESAYTEAEYDHHAFLWWEPAGLAVLPLSDGSFYGAAGFNVGRAGIGEAGRAEHEGQAQVRRAFVAGGRLYTLSEAGLEANSLTTLAEEAALRFPSP